MSKESSYWKSLRHYYNNSAAEETKANEFMSGVTEKFDVNEMSGISRKKFLALLSASAAFAAAGCSNYRDKGEIIPYNKKPEEITLGKANYYASTCTGCASSCGILIKTREGRPIKIDGNPDHPINKGKICSQGQASVLNLYDPERLREPLHKRVKSSWNAADNDIIAALKNSSANKKEIALITHTIVSPSLKKILDEFIAQYPTAKIYSYELFNEEQKKSAWKKSTGGNSVPLIQWEKAKIILSLEGDFLGNEGNVIEQTRLFTQNRDVMKGKDFNRLYCAEGGMTITGMNADYRLKIRPDQQYQFVMSLLNEIIVQKKVSKISVDTKVLANYSLSNFAKEQSLNINLLEKLVSDLIQHKGEGIIYAGSYLPESVHIAVNLLNEVLGNSALYNSTQSSVEYQQYSTKEEWETLVQKMNVGEVGAVIHLDTNPVYHLAADYKYSDALKKVSLTVTLGEYENETSAISTYTLPINHAFESWGDFKTRTGIYSLQQPVIAPLYNTRQKESALLVWISGNSANYKEVMYHEYLMNRWEKEVYPSLKLKSDFKSFWYSALHDGVITYSENSEKVNSIKTAVISELKETSVSSSGKFTLLLHNNYSVGDGRFANNGWLQEIPHPVTRAVWDNYAAISPSTAKELGVENNMMIEVSINNQKLKLPVYIQPGAANKFVDVMLGYGRSVVGSVGSNVGFNANVFISKNSPLTSWIYTDVSVAKTSEKYEIVSTQEYHSLDDTFVKDFHYKREIIQEGTVEEYEKDPLFIKREHHAPKNIVKDIEYNGVKWAMAIDLNKCTGCATCVSACNIENNIPIVGKEQVKKGREMMWLRIDRYFSGTPDEPKASVQPMLCQHCDNAPCETVCPVTATTHSEDGLNQMVYNRCVGTKYCSNNCPYKVRRFNFFDFRNDFADGYQEQEPINLMYNPEVTVRSRGVMEKCTFCIQRIMDARQNATEEGRSIEGKDVTTACQQACPAEAIVFGDMNDKESEVSKYREHELGYHVLEEINVRPNVTYIAKLRNVQEV